jgi:Kef-type K+ transport system membrane component KefB
MSITAFPVLARILSERKLLRSKMGTMAISCAAVDDATGWCVLAYVVAFVRASHTSLPLWATVMGLPAYLAVMIFGGRKLLMNFERAYQKDNELSNNRTALLLVFVMVSALTTELLGLHLLFGAFVAGAIMPKHPGLMAYLIEKFESLTMLLLLPLFFAYTGLRTSIGEIRGAGMWGICLLIILVAVSGKLGGTGIAARLSGMSWKDSIALGSLMNTRGLMELVVLNIGLDIKLISPALFSMMVVMAIATTMMAPPVLAWVYPTGSLTAERKRASRTAIA